MFTVLRLQLNDCMVAEDARLFYTAAFRRMKATLLKQRTGLVIFYRLKNLMVCSFEI